MVKKFNKNIVLSLMKDANYLVSLQLVKPVVTNTTKSGLVLSQNQFDPIGLQVIGGLFYYFTSILLLTT